MPEHDDAIIPPPATPSRSPVGNLALACLLVAFCAAIASGSCAGFANSTTDAFADGERGGVGSVFLPALLSAGLTLAVGLGYILLARPRPVEVGTFVAINITAYIAGMLGAWFLIIVPAIVAFAVIIAGGLIARWIMSNHVAGSRWRVAAISSLAIALATFGFVGGFWANYDPHICLHIGCGSGSTTFNAVPFAIVAGAVPPLCAAIGSIRIRELYDVH